MDIHAPDKPILSLKEFLIHIAVVTLGILIALGLEGIRETVHDHRLVRETRENFDEELSNAQMQVRDERARVEAGHQILDSLTAKLPALGEQHPEQVLATLESVHNPNYFFGTNSWQAALSTGALAHMSADEVSAYAWSAEAARVYSGFQHENLESQVNAVAWWQSHPKPTPDQLGEGMERIYLWTQHQKDLAYVVPQNERSIADALKFATR